MSKMAEKQTCSGCKYSTDLKGCASFHAEEALKLLSEGKVEEAEKNLKGLQQRLEK
jgi:hypothetical protein